RNTTIRLGPTPLFINGTVNSKDTPAQLNVNLKANNVSIAEMAKLAASSGMALTPGTTVTGNVNADINARGPADKPALTGTVNGAGTLNLDMHAAGPLRAISSDEIMKALNGTLNLNFNNVKYSGADVNHELHLLLDF